MDKNSFYKELRELKNRVTNKEKDISTSIKLFEDKRVRTDWVENEEEWYFSVVDVIAVLTDQPDTRHAAKYWSVLKNRLKNEEGSELPTICSQLKLKSADGKRYNTDVANTEQLLRIIQSVPSPKAEPFKLWLASVGNDRINEMQDPELAIERALLYYKRKGYSDSWINQRLKSIEIRKDLTDEWLRSGVTDGRDYATLTDEISKSWSGMSTRQYKNYKGLKKESLRDNMSNMELVLNMLAEASAAEISKAQNPTGLEESKDIARKGGDVARVARENLEKQTGESVITQKNASDLNRLEEK